MLRHLAFAPGAADTPAPQDLAFDAATLARLAGGRRLFDAMATHLGPVFARPTLAWWHALRRDQGAARVDAAARLFLVPGLAHCRGGAGSPTGFDTLTPLLRWAEEGVAPDSLAGGHVQPAHDAASEPFLGAERFGPRR